ncbi:glycosyltransferase family 2 protein [Rhodococcus sp. IEGM 1343]|uniref:glycosyltransferase family 2 protein n=1 Tax=Rhodococcus sp. IEGM 1343 TaxID=3082224 RepID=UPI00295441F6|nr:glycosyltransferase family 2 protein [Rhodococcus sp. IEGM 1343]MDV8055976.1 glycosyltransferase family 2 protein [Rhodococcus sp. IEGM 1343]
MSAPDINARPDVTVITAAYNAESTIREAIESIESQTFSNWELIVVDDASTDSTRAYVTEAAKRDARIKPIFQPTNCGSGAARNLALKLASGHYVAVMDADDISTEQRLERQVSFLDSRTDLAGVGAQLLEFGDWGGPRTSSWPVSEEEIKKRQKSKKMPIPHPSTMLRTKVALDAGGYDEACRRSQDYALFLQMRDKRFACLSEPLVYYRTHRPITLEYAIKSGRYAELAKHRATTAAPRDQLRTTPRSLPLSLTTDLRSAAQWLKRILAERK